MKKIHPLTTLAFCASLLLLSTNALAGDGTKSSPYTIAELNAQKEALSASGQIVWVRADLIGLGEDGKSIENADTEVDGKTIHQMAALFSDATGSFVAYSEAILQNLAISDLTNTKNLLISLTYGAKGHPYGNTQYPEYASYNEPEAAHFSLDEVHGALSLEIKGGYRGYHIPSSYVIPQDIVAVKVSAGYSLKSGAYLNCENVFDGASATIVTPKNISPQNP